MKRRFANGTIITCAMGVISACTVVIGELPEGKDPTVNAGGEAGDGGVAGSLAGSAGSSGGIAGSDASSGGGTGGVAGSADVAGASGAGGSGGTTCKVPPCDCDGDNHYAETTECGRDDCDDLDNRAFPGQTTFFFTPTIGNGDFDFNCDGAETPELPQHNCSGAACLGATVGFLGAPTCGTLSTWAKCVAAVGCSASPDGTAPANCH